MAAVQHTDVIHVLDDGALTEQGDHRVLMGADCHYATWHRLEQRRSAGCRLLAVQVVDLQRGAPPERHQEVGEPEAGDDPAAGDAQPGAGEFALGIRPS